MGTVERENRGRKQRWAAMGLAGIVVAGCSHQEPDQTTETRAGALTSQTASFRDGVNGYAGTLDTRIVQNTASSNFGTSMALTVDGDDPTGSGRDVATLVRWDLSSIPVGSTVQAATMTLSITDASTQSYPIYALRRAWTETGATWAVASPGSAWQTSGARGANDRETTSLGSLAPAATGAYTLTLNAAGVAKVQQWVTDPAANFGVIVAHATNTNKLSFSSSETAVAANRPALAVTYLVPTALDGGAPSDGAAGGAGGAPDAGGGVDAAGGSGGTDGGSGGGGGSGPTDAAPAGASGNDAGTAGAGQGGAAGNDAGGAGGTGGSTPGPVVLYAAGDIGDCASTGDTGTGILLDGTTDPIALLGDIAYPNASLGDFTNCFDPPWGRHKARIRPVPGNHEYNMAGALGYFTYFGSAAGDLGKGYYSYDLGGWHVVALNSNCTSVSCAAGDAQEQWLRQDLAAHPGACTLAYWHHPRWSSGSHGNNTNMTAIWQALADGGADLILNGHDHGYERWAPMDRSGNASANGMVEIIVGTGGTALRGFSGTKPTNSVIRSAASHGVLKLTLRESAYDWEFKPVAGQSFTDAGTATCR